MRGVFVTGTDTGIGKTRVATALVRAMNARGVATVGMKPVASGCIEQAQGWRNDDALALIEAAGDRAPEYARVNRYALPEPVAPHLAARRAGIGIAIPELLDDYRDLSSRADCVIVEGVGGWAVPLSDAVMQADLARALGLPVLLVVGIRLGCINHALLTAAAVAADGLELAGWIANRVDPAMLLARGSVDAISRHLGRAPLDELPWARGELPDAGALENTTRMLAGRD